MRKTAVILIGILLLAGLASAQTVEELMAQGREALNRGAYQDAVTKFRAVISREPSNFEAQLGLGQALLGLNILDQAVRELNKALAFQPQNPAVWFNLGAAYVQLEDEGHAVQALLKSIQYGPDSAAKIRDLAQDLFRRGDFGKARIADLVVIRATSLSGYDRAAAHGELGWIALNRDHQPQSALESYRQATLLNDRHIVYWEGLARAHEALGEKDKAIAALEKCLTLTSNPQRIAEIKSRISALKK